MYALKIHEVGKEGIESAEAWRPTNCSGQKWKFKDQTSVVYRASKSKGGK